jgi:3'-phosphoadenosine 5'-phosphosulfate sulfotransferase (PAPS reductase)/FAD synthetase
MNNGKIVCWFSCGAASAVATKLALAEHPDAVVAYQDTGMEHPDNVRFLKDCEAWFGKEVKVLKSERYQDAWEVWEHRRYLAGVAGAPCTGELKRKVAEDFLFSELGVGTPEGRALGC